MTTEQTKPELLDEAAVAEIEAWKTNSYGSMVNLPVAKRDALCATVRAAWATVAEWESHRDGIIEAIKTAEARVEELEEANAALREQLAESVDALKQLRRIVGAREIGADTETWIDDIIKRGEQP